MSKHKFFLLVALVAVFLTACSNNYYYLKGLDRAQAPTQAQVCNTLIPVITSNTNLSWNMIDGQPYVLAVTWKAAKDTGYFTQKDNYDAATKMYRYDTRERPLFVTVAPELKQQHLGGLNDKKLTMRLNQLLGLPPVSSYSCFIEEITPEKSRVVCS